MMEMPERFITSFRAAGRKNAFSLVELVIAIGVTTFCLVIIISMLPVGLHTAQKSRYDTRAAYLSEQIIGDLRSSPFTQATILCLQSDGTLAPLPTTLNLANASTMYLACDDQNNVLQTAITSAQYTSGVSSAGVEYLVQITVAPTVLDKLSTVSVEVSAPAQGALITRSRYGFQTMIGNKQ